MQERPLICNPCSEVGVATWPTQFRCEQCRRELGFQQRRLCTPCSQAGQRGHACGTHVERHSMPTASSGKYLLYDREKHGPLYDRLKTLLTAQLGAKFFEPDVESTYSHTYFRLRGAPPNKQFFDLTPWSGGSWEFERYRVPIIGINSFPDGSANLLVWSSAAQQHIVVLTVADALRAVAHEVQLETDRIEEQIAAALQVFYTLATHRRLK